jgi:O-antigen ligase
MIAATGSSLRIEERGFAGIASDARHLAIVLLPASYFIAVVTQYRWYFLCLALVVMAGVAREWHRFVSWQYSRRLLLPLAAFLLSLALSSTWALDPAVSLTGLALPVTFAFLCWSVAGWAQEQPFLRQTTPLVVLVWGIAAVYVYVFLRFGTLKPIDEDVATVFGAGSNAGAMHLVAALPMLLWRMRVHPRMSSRLAIGLTVGLLVVSGTRAAYLVAPLVAAASLLAFGEQRKVRLSSLMKAGVMVAATAGLVAATPLGQSTIERLGATTATLLDPTDLLEPQTADYERALTYLEGWRAFTEHPVTGIGYQNLRVWIEHYYGFGTSSHNLLVTLLSEAGWPATFAFGALMIVFFGVIAGGRRIDPRPQARNYYAAVAVSMAGSLGLAMFHQLLDFQMFYILLGIATAAPVLPRFNPGLLPSRLIARLPGNSQVTTSD